MAIVLLVVNFPLVVNFQVFYRNFTIVLLWFTWHFDFWLLKIDYPIGFQIEFYGKVTISPSILKTAVIKARMKEKDPSRRLNATVAILLSSWFSYAELANLSLSGKGCPSIADSVAKPKFPEVILEAITRNYLVDC